MRRVGILVAALLAISGCRRDVLVPLRSRLVVACPSPPAMLDPGWAHEEIAFAILRNVYDCLFEFDGSLGLHPALVESWSSPDENTWVFRLRRDVAFHDGRKLDAEAVRASLEEGFSRPLSDLPGSAISSIEAPDPETVLIRTARPVPALPVYLQGMMVWGRSQPGSSARPGTGPYEIALASARRVKLRRVALQGQARAEIGQIDFETIPDPKQRLRALERGTVDLVIDPPAERIPELGKNPRVRIAIRDGLRVVFLGFDCRKGRNPRISSPENPFASARVREAVGLAIDRQAIVRDAMRGYASVIDQVVTPEVAGYDPGIEPFRFDPGEAGKLLAAAGVPRGLRVDLTYARGKYRGSEEAVRWIAASLARVGISVRPDPVGVPELFARLQRHDVALYLLGWLTSTEAGVSLQDLFRSPVESAGAFNFGGYSNPAADSIIDRAVSTSNDETRIGLYHQAAELIRKDVPVVPLYRQADLYAFARDLEFRPRADRRIVAEEISWREPASGQIAGAGRP